MTTAFVIKIKAVNSRCVRFKYLHALYLYIVIRVCFINIVKAAVRQPEAELEHSERVGVGGSEMFCVKCR